MTVAELIEKLQKFPASAEVAVEQPYCAEESWLVPASPGLYFSGEFNWDDGKPAPNMVVSLSPGYPGPIQRPIKETA